MKKLTVLLVLLVLVAIVAAPVLAGDGIGRATWARKCPAEMSVIVTELPGGVNLVECFLYFDTPTEEQLP